VIVHPGDRIEPPAPEYAEPIVAWRTWRLFVGADGLEPRLVPVVGGSRPWPAGRAARARCGRGRRHEVPGLLCTCGLYAASSPDPLRHTRDPAVVGTVALWGRVAEHRTGFRAEFGYPQRLALVCYLCFWRTPAEGSRPDVVARLRGGRLVPLCEPHVELSNRYGYATPGLVPADEVEARLLSTYAVERLAA
jgi:hypothetical protein